MAERALIGEIDHPTAERVPNISPPFRFSETPVVDPVAAPTLGEHTRFVLARTLGYDDAKIDALVETGALGGH